MSESSMSPKVRFRRSKLAAAIGVAIALSSGTAAFAGAPMPPTLPEPGIYFTPFADDDLGAPPNPEDLANAMLQTGGNVTVTGAGFQGNTSVSAYFGGYYNEGGGFYGGGGFDGPAALLIGGYYGGYNGPVPDTLLGHFPGAIPPGAPGVPLPAPLAVDDDSSPLGEGLADAMEVPGGGPLTLAVSGFDDFNFNGLDDDSEIDNPPGNPHFEEGNYVLYLSVMDGVNDPDFSGGSDPTGVDSEDFYDPLVHADLAIGAYLGTDGNNFFTLDDIDTFTFDPGTVAAGDGGFSLEPGALILPEFALSPGFLAELGVLDSAGSYAGSDMFNPLVDPAAQAQVQNFLDLLDSGANVAAVIDNIPLGGYGGYGGYGTEFLGSASFVEGLNLGTGPGGEDLNFGDGILLTSGVGTPPDENTSGSFSGNAGGLGDGAAQALLDAAFASGLIETPAASVDATVLTFDFTVPDGANAVEFDFMYGTEEFPNWNYPDVAGIFVDGRNYAVFSDGTPTIFDPDTPIADLLVDNNSIPGPHAIEYDAISPVRRMVAPLADLGDGATHTFKAVISDARDTIYDTGLFLANFVATTVPVGTDPSDPILPVPDDDPTDGFDFRIQLGDAGLGLNPLTPIWIDPDIAIGYTYTVDPAQTTFASAELPFGFDDDLYEVSWWDPTANGGTGAFVKLIGTHANDQFMAGEVIDFLGVSGGAGITSFQVLGIDVGNGLDPLNPLAFMTGLVFTSGGTTVDVNMNPITTFVNPNPPGIPEPGVLFLMGSGMLAFGAVRRRKRQA